MRRRLALAALAALAAVAVPLVGADVAKACSCVPLDEREQLEKSDGAFIGRLVAIRPVDPPDEGEPIGSGDPTDYVYRVGRVFNGGQGLRRGRRIRVRSVRSGASCGLPGGRGRLYGLFVERTGRRWHGNLCRTTTPRRMRRAARAGATATIRPCRSR